MAKQGGWVLKNLKHDKPGVTISNATLKYQSKTLSIGSITSKKHSDMTTEWFTDLGVRLTNSAATPSEGSIIEYAGLKYRVHWNIRQTVQPEPEPEPVITYRLRITGGQEDCLPYNGTAEFYAILEKLVDGVHIEEDDLLVTDTSTWSFTSGGDYVTRNAAGSTPFSITGNNTSDSVQTVNIKVEYDGQSNVQPATTSVCFNPEEEVPVERDLKISITKIDADCEDNALRSVSVTATNVEWTVTVSQNAQSWLSVQDITSSGFKVKILDYDGASRSGTITVKSTTEGTNITRTITVKQEDCEPVVIVPKLEISISEIDALCKNNQTYSVTVTAENTEWDVTKCNTCSWITISNKTSTGFEVSIADSTDNERTGTVTVQSTTEGVNITREITITQPDCRETEEPYLRYTTNLEVCEGNKYCLDCDDNTRYSITVESNVEWTAGTSDAWIHVTNISSTGFKVWFDNNPDDDREGTVTIWPTDRTLSSLDKELTIKQRKCEEPPITQETISLGTIADIPCDADGTYFISVTASTAWTAEVEPNVDWLHIEEMDDDSITVTFDANEGGNRSGIISAYTTEGGTMAWDSVTVTQLECEEQPTFNVDDDDILFECYGDTYEIEVEASEGVTWTARTTDNDFEIKTGSTSFTNEVTGTGNGTVIVKSLAENRNVGTNVVYEDVIEFTSSLGDNKTIDIYQEPTPIFEYTGGNEFSFDETGGSTSISIVTNFDVNVSINQTGNWLSYTKGNLDSTADDGLVITFTAEQNGIPQERSASISINSNYQGECASPDAIELTVEQEAKYVPPIPGAKFNVTDIFADFPYYAELGGFSHEYSFMSEEFYDNCGLSDGDVGGVVYLMPVHSCAIQVYYDTNIDLSNLTYEIVHVSPQNPEQEWLEVLMDPSKYRCLEEYPDMECGWSDTDSRDEPYPGDFILIKTRDTFEGNDLYNDEYTGYVKIKVASTGQVLRTIPVKCIAVDISGEKVKVSDSANGSKKGKLTLGSNDSPAVGAMGGFVDLWVYTNDSAYFSDHDDNDISWNKLSFYYEDGETIIPVTRDQDPEGMGYIDKICDTRCNPNEFLHIKVKVEPNCLFSNVERGFELSTENAGYRFLDLGLKDNAEVTIIQARNRTSESNYRVEEFFVANNEMTPVWDSSHPYGGEYKYITGATCDGTGHTITPTIQILYDESQLCNPGVTTPREPLNDNRVIYDETYSHNVANPSVIEASIQYLDGTSWIVANPNYYATTGQPFEFYIQPYTGYTDTDNGNTERSAKITVTYKNCSPQISRELKITQSYMKVAPAELPVQLYVLDIYGNRIGNDTEATVTPSGNSNGFAFEITNGSNVEARLTITNGSIPYQGSSPSIETDLNCFSSLTTTFGTTATPMTQAEAFSMYFSGILYPDSGYSNFSRYNVYTKGHAFDLHLICTSRTDEAVKKEMIIHVNAV